MNALKGEEPLYESQLALLDRQGTYLAYPLSPVKFSSALNAGSSRVPAISTNRSTQACSSSGFDGNGKIALLIFALICDLWFIKKLFT